MSGKFSGNHVICEIIFDNMYAQLLDTMVKMVKQLQSLKNCLLSAAKEGKAH